MKLFTSISLLTLLHLVQSQLTLTSDGCVDPQGFDSCMNTATQQAQMCFKQNCNSNDASCDSEDKCFTNDPKCVTACTCGAYQSWINCAITSCWNRAYSCEYQNLVINSVRECGVALNIVYPPYFPPPAASSNPPGACSCQIGNLYGEIRSSPSEATACQNYVGTLSNQGQLNGQESADLTACSCCAASRAVSALAAVCPNTDPSAIPFYQWSSAYSSAASGLQSQGCQNAFSQSLDCTAEPFNFTLPNNGKFYGAGNVPSAGSQQLSNAPGTLTAPKAATITWSLAQGLVPSTAVAAKASGGSSSGGSSGSSGSGGSGGSGSSASGSSASSTSTSQPTAKSGSAATGYPHAIVGAGLLLVAVNSFMLIL